MKNKIVYAFDLKKSCGNCKNWTSINKTLDVGAISCKVGECKLAKNILNKYYTEKSGCELFAGIIRG